MAKSARALFLLGLFGVFGVVSLLAQVSTSSITGVVTDSTGAIVANAKVEAKNDDTGVMFDQNTTNAGTYAFPSLTPGSYSITVRMTGFQTFTSAHNVLTVGTPLVVEVVLKVGAATETVEVVESNYQRIDTSNATVSDIMDTKQVESLPLNGRNPLALLTLEPGVVQRTTGGAGSGTHVFGSRDRAHNVTIDGIDANESTVPNPQGNIQRLNPDNVQEFRTVTLGATAEDGRNSGANVIIAMKPGTNAFHGSVFYFNRNTDYNANEWFSNYEGRSRPELKLNEYGFAVGGPIVKNKTFFFGSFQNNQINQTEPVSATSVGVAGFGSPTVYTALARTGSIRFLRGCINFVNPACPKGDPNNITGNSPLLVDSKGNLLPGVPTCSTTVTGNCVDTYNIFTNDPQAIGGDPTVLALMNSLPAANAFSLGDGLNQAGFNWNPPSQFKGPHYYVRVDHTFGPNDNVFVRWLQNTFDTKQGDFLNARPQVYPGFPPLGEVNRLGKNLAISYRHSFSPTLVNELTAGFNRFRFEFTFGESNPNFPNPAKVPIWADDCVLGSMQNVDPPYCLSPHTQRAITTPQLVDNISWIRGAHTLRAGINFRFYIHNDSRGFFGGNVVSPIIRFNQLSGGAPQLNRVANFSNLPTTGDGTTCPTCANSTDINLLQQAGVELLGIPSRIQQAFLANFASNTYGSTNFATVYTRAHQYDSYVQDEWKLRHSLTLNLGVRWEYNPAPYDAKQTLVPNVFPDGSQGAVTYAKADRWFKNNNIGAVGPRMAIAWSPNAKTTVRSGYSWLFDTLSTFQVTAMAGKMPGFLINCLVNIPTTGAATVTNGCVVPSALAANPGVRISTGFPTGVPTPTITPSAALSPITQASSQAPAVGAFDPNIKNPSVHEWDLTIQRELPKHFVAEIGYIGKRGTHLYRAYDLNQVSINGAGFLDSFNIAMKNRQIGCRPDGTNCPLGVTSQTPTLLLQMMPAATLNRRTSDFDTYNIGNLANFIDGLTGTGTFWDPASTLPRDFFRPNPQFGQIFFQDSGGDSYYHGVFVAARRRFEQGLDLAFSYTFSKSIDDMSIDPTGASTGGGLSTTNSRTPTDIHNWRLDRALSDFNNTHVLLANLLYEFPFGKGKKLVSSAPGWANQIIGGWSFTGIFDYQSGEPYSITSGSLTGNGAHVSYAQVRGPLDQGHVQFVNGIEGPVMYHAGKRITNSADPNFNCVNVIGTQTFFCIPLPGQQGNGRNIVQGPDFWNLDSGLLKDFGLTERFKLQFRAEAFNVLNHANWENPRNATAGSPSVRSSIFGRTCCVAAALPSSATVIAIGEPNRVLQLGLKLNF